MRALVLVAALAMLIAGCVTPGASLDPAQRADVPFDDLATTASDVVDNGDGTRTMVFTGAFAGNVGTIGIVDQVEGPTLGTFDVDERVGFARLEVAPASGPSMIAGVIQDEEGTILCAAFKDAPCSVPVVGAATWSVAARVALGAQEPGSPVTTSVTLHPPSHIVRGDPLAGVDASIRFRVSDTGVEGAEDNIGVLGDGTIFTQKDVKTMRSRDDGVSWETVSPPGNDFNSFDPMLFVDPTRGVVFVDHLYVACSVLSWSRDAGSTWITNPLACGGPANDHQKVASGPNPLPGAPFPAVHYTYSSFVQGIWASRSLDGGVTWTTTPVAGIGDGHDFANTGPIFADEAGNVFIPLYVCNGEGSMGVGVSHDHGLTWKYVEAVADPGPCYDVDPGIWTDTDGTVYLAYHRPTGVKYAFSKDAGETWSAPVTVSPPSLRSFVHVDAVAGDAGRLAIVYRATPDTDKGPDLAEGWAAWHLYVSFVEGATSATPTIRTAIVNDPASPIQRGPICTNGVACFGGSRNLLDFIDIAVGPDGRVYPTYTDGCDGDCPLPSDSRGRMGHVGVQVEGPRLFVDRAPWAK